MSEDFEIERKFLVSGGLPDLVGAEASRMRQGYVATGETEVRLRDEDGALTLTCKRGDGLVRREEEVTLDQAQFDALWRLTEGCRVEKTRYRLPYGEHCIEIDVFEGLLQSLVVAEVEFHDVAASEAFVIPDYFGEDVTSDKRYKNRNLALSGLPEAQPMR